MSSWYRYTTEDGDVIYQCECGYEIRVSRQVLTHQPRIQEIIAHKQRTHEQQQPHRPRDPVLEQEC